MKMLEAAYVIQEECKKQASCLDCSLKDACDCSSPDIWEVPEQPHTSTNALTVEVKATELEPVKELFDAMLRAKLYVDTDSFNKICGFDMIWDKFSELFGDQFDTKR